MQLFCRNENKTNVGQNKLVSTCRKVPTKSNIKWQIAFISLFRQTANCYL